MTGAGTNILVNAHRAESKWPEKAKRLIQDLAEGHATWATPRGPFPGPVCLGFWAISCARQSVVCPWPCMPEFLSVVTHPRVFWPPTPLEVELEQVGAWMQSPSLVLLAVADAYWPALYHLIAAGDVVGPRIHDVRLAALCLPHGVIELLSADRDFHRFPGLRVCDPFIDQSAG